MRNRGTNNSRLFRFKHSDELLKFVLMYKDLFVPYSDYIQNYESVNRDGEVVNGRFVRSENYGRRDENMKWMLANGYRIYDDMRTVKVNVTPESLDEILSSGSFEKIKERRNVYSYRLREAV